jgi:hypothetical protein
VCAPRACAWTCGAPTQGVDGSDIVGDDRYCGDDVEHIVWWLRALGTKDEAEALQVETIIRYLTDCECGWTFQRRPEWTKARYAAR